MRKLADESASRLAKSLASEQSDFGRAAQLLDWVAAQLEQINAQQAELKTRKREADALQSSLTTRLKELQTHQGNREKIVAVLVEATGEGQWNLELSYIVGGARWTPLYDARVSTGADAKFVLSLNALVTQKSGENWENVALKLSTARPGLGSLPPKLEPLWVNEATFTPKPIYAAALRSAAPMMARSRVPGGGEAMEMAEADETEYEPIEAQEVVADVESSSHGATVEFALPHTLSVPGDGQSHRVAIAVREFPTKFDFLAIPRRIEIAYLRAKATNNSELALLAGEVSIFRDGVFVGKAQLKNTAPGGELELFLGPDEQIRAKREMTARETDKNFIGNAKRVHFAYAIELHNLKAQAVVLEVRDQIPVSRSENIKVKLRGATPEAVQSDLGVLEWRVNLGAGEKKTLRFDYGVESGRDTTVVGLTD